MIKAECHSDDGVFKAHFDATPFFAEATDTQIVNLAACGWANDYPADAVAHHVSTLKGYGEVAAVMNYLPRLKDMGFECSVEPGDALAWIAKERPRTLALIGAALAEQHNGKTENEIDSLPTQDAVSICLVEIGDVITIERSACLLVASTRDEAEEKVLERANRAADIEWDEEQSSAEPYHATLNGSADALRFADLVDSRRNPGGLDPDKTAEFDALARDLGVTDAELRRFGERHIGRGPLTPD